MHICVSPLFSCHIGNAIRISFSLPAGGYTDPPLYIIMCIRLREVFRFVLFDSAQFPNDGAEAEYQEINQAQLQRADAYPVNLSGGQ